MSPVHRPLVRTLAAFSHFGAKAQRFASAGDPDDVGASLNG